MPKTREELIELVCDAMEDGCIGHCNYPPCFRVELVVNALVANGVTIPVRCKDCTHGVIDACTNRLMCAKGAEIRPNGHVWGGTAVSPNHFCSYGERREGNA